MISQENWNRIRKAGFNGVSDQLGLWDGHPFLIGVFLNMPELFEPIGQFLDSELPFIQEVISSIQNLDEQISPFCVGFAPGGTDCNLGTTALMTACQLKNLSLVKLILESGANIALQDDYKQSALFFALDSPVIFQYLLECGIDSTLKNYQGLQVDEAIELTFSDWSWSALDRVGAIRCREILTLYRQEQLKNTLPNPKSKLKNKFRI